MSLLQNQTTIPIDDWRLLLITEHHIPSMAPEFDPNPQGHTWTEVRLINLSNDSITEIGWRELKDIYNDSKGGWFKKRKIYIWNLIRSLTPYEHLSKIQQQRYDRYHNRYPNPDSKYFQDLDRETIQEILDQMALNVIENINDARMYRDIPYTERSVYKRQRNQINKLKEALSIKN